MSTARNALIGLTLVVATACTGAIGFVGYNLMEQNRLNEKQELKRELAQSAQDKINAQKPKESVKDPQVVVVTPSPTERTIVRPVPVVVDNSANDRFENDSPAFNAEINDPPTNCRATPSMSGTVQKVLQRGDVKVTLVPSNGWHQEQYLGCWIHNSQLTFK